MLSSDIYIRLKLFPTNNEITSILVLGLMTLANFGCALSGYEKDLFASDHVVVVHSKKHCNETVNLYESELANADLVFSRVDGLGRLVATNAAWEVQARQLATELDANYALIRPCDGDGAAWEYAQIQLFRDPAVNLHVLEEPSAAKGTLIASSQTSYGSRLKNIINCLKHSHANTSPLAIESKNRLDGFSAMDFFSSDAYFPGYAKLDKYFRPTNQDELRLSMVLSERSSAEYEARYYNDLTPEDKTHYAEQYLNCLLDRGYHW